MKVVCNTRHRTYKDGGSKQWDVLNTKECGYTSVYQDNSISSKLEGKSGLYYGQKNGNQTLLNVSDIEWASQYKPTKTMKTKVMLLSDTDEAKFEKDLQKFVEEGWKIQGNLNTCFMKGQVYGAVLFSIILQKTD